MILYRSLIPSFYLMISLINSLTNSYLLYIVAFPSFHILYIDFYTYFLIYPYSIQYPAHPTRGYIQGYPGGGVIHPYSQKNKKGLYPYYQYPPIAEKIKKGCSYGSYSLYPHDSPKIKKGVYLPLRSPYLPPQPYRRSRRASFFSVAF